MDIKRLKQLAGLNEAGIWRGGPFLPDVAKDSAKGSLPQHMWALMRKHKIQISSHGSGVGVSFVDSQGKEHYEEFGDLSNLREIVERTLEEINFNDQQHQKQRPGPYRG